MSQFNFTHLTAGNTLHSNKHHFHYLNIPGYNNSGEGHWQTIWESLYPDQFTRVEQESWEYPEPKKWIDTINGYVIKINEPVILVAHSLGCVAAVHFIKQYHPKNIAGAFFVAPADAEKSPNPVIHAFAPVPTDRLPFHSVVIASTNDPFAATHRLANYAACWGSKFICLGDKGHINASSDLGNWNEGWNILQKEFPEKIFANAFD